MSKTEKARELAENENRCPVCCEIVTHLPPESRNRTAVVWDCPTCLTPIRLAVPLSRKTHNGFVLVVNVKEYRKRQGLPAEWE